MFRHDTLPQQLHARQQESESRSTAGDKKQIDIGSKSAMTQCQIESSTKGPRFDPSGGPGSTPSSPRSDTNQPSIGSD